MCCRWLLWRLLLLNCILDMGLILYCWYSSYINTLCWRLLALRTRSLNAYTLSSHKIFINFIKTKVSLFFVIDFNINWIISINFNPRNKNVCLIILHPENTSEISIYLFNNNYLISNFYFKLITYTSSQLSRCSDISISIYWPSVCTYR